MIFLLESIHPDAVALLEKRGEVRLSADPLVVDSDVQRGGVEAILTRGRGRITAAMLDEFPDLVVVGRCGAGLDNIDVAAAAERGIAVVNAPGATTAAVAEHAVLLMLGLARRITALDAAVKAGNWSVRDGYTGAELRGKRLGVVGLGSIGRRVAELGRAFEMEVVYWSPTSRGEGLTRVGLDELLASSDVVQVCIALATGTHHLLDARRLGLMGPLALLVNTSRGAIVDHQALIAAITSGRLAGYATDVWDPEPPPDADLAELGDRVLVTPHVAAITDVTYRQICVTTVEAAIAALTVQTNHR
ncbi:MAG: NAD(P)-dependent oxidoreductase [Ilumatobacteraceae bacterium]